MDLTFSETEAAFRDELRTWFENNDPGPEPAGDDSNYAWRRDWQRRLAEGGWAGVHWPREYGGPGAAVTEAALFFQGLRRAPAPPPPHGPGPPAARPTDQTGGTRRQEG